MAFEDIEQFRILFLDKKNRLIADEVQQTRHGRSHAGLSARGDQAVAGALGHGADPGAQPPLGRPVAVTADVQMTRQIADIAKPLGITVHDHIIIGKSGHASLKGLKLI